MSKIHITQHGIECLNDYRMLTRYLLHILAEHGTLSIKQLLDYLRDKHIEYKYVESKIIIETLISMSNDDLIKIDLEK